MFRLNAVMVDGSAIDEQLPNHEISEVEIMVQETEESLFIRIEIEDAKGNLIYQYKRKTTYVY